MSRWMKISITLLVLATPFLCFGLLATLAKWLQILDRWVSP